MPLFDDDDDSEFARKFRKQIETRDALFAKVRALLPPAIGDAIFHLKESTELQAAARQVFRNTPQSVLYDIVFHLTDWRQDAACLLALTAHPDHFSAAETKGIIVQFLVHAPNHVAAAARLSGHPIRDIFNLGTLLEQPGEDALPVLR